MRSNNANELQMTQFLREQGIIHHFSCPYRPEQNSVVERKHQHLLNVARLFIFQAKLPIKLWGDYIARATFVIN